MIVIAHRGASAHAPEHTLAAYDLAVEMGADYIEQDLQLTSDGVLVVMHDATLDRTTRGLRSRCRGPVIRRTLAEVRSCDAGAWFNLRHPERARPEYAGLQVPTLDEVLARYSGRSRFYIETKNPEEAPGMEDRLVALLDQHGLRDAARDHRASRTAVNGWDPPPPVVIQSFSEASLRRVRTLAPELPLVQLFSSRSGRRTVAARLSVVAAYAAGIGPHHGVVDARLVEDAHAHGLVVHPYTVNDEPLMRRLIAVHADGVFTDRPDRLRAVLGAD